MSDAPFRPLRPGDPIGVFAPAGPVDPERYEAGLTVLRERYRVIEASNVRERASFFAGTDERRRAATQRLFDDPELRALIAARGGYGTMRILSSLSLARFERDPIPVVGFSDLTALHLGFRARGLSSVHGPVVTQLDQLEEVDRQALWDVFEGGSVARDERSANLELRLVPGSAEPAALLGNAPLVGGNLSLVSALAGTRFLPSLRGCLVFLEDVGERPYRLDRMLVQLELAGAFEGALGLVFGDFTDCEPPKDEVAPTWEDVIRERSAAIGLPAWVGFPAGHGKRNLAFVQGVRLSLSAAGDGVWNLHGL